MTGARVPTTLIAMSAPPRADLLEAVSFHPIDDEAVRRKEPHERPVFDELQRAYPSVELLLR